MPWATPLVDGCAWAQISVAICTLYDGFMVQTSAESNRMNFYRTWMRPVARFLLVFMVGLVAFAVLDWLRLRDIWSSISYGDIICRAALWATAFTLMVFRLYGIWRRRVNRVVISSSEIL
jgi:hypothetical protein